MSIAIAGVITGLVIFLLVRDIKHSRKELAIIEKSRLELEKANKELDESKDALSDALSVAEHAAVNRRVVGSSPTGGANWVSAIAGAFLFTWQLF